MFFNLRIQPERWLRNTERQPASFKLPTPRGSFYPDFVALLKDGSKTNYGKDGKTTEKHINPKLGK